MFSNYLKIAFRNLLKHKSYSAINIVGLAIGLACCIVILLHVQDELRFDAFHENADRIFRITETRQAPDGAARSFAVTMGPIGPALLAEVPGVAGMVRMRDRSGIGRMAVKYGANSFYEGNHLFVESGFFDLFDFPLIQGNPQTALTEPRTVVLTESASGKYFGSENAVGKILSTDRFGDFKVTGVLQDPPKNSHLDFSMLLSFATLEANPGFNRFINSWDSDGFITYVRTKDDIPVGELNARLEALVRKHRGDAPKESRTLAFQPLRDIHFGSAALEVDRNSRKAEIASVYIISAIALFVLLIACINYTNLATARSMKRGKEVGMRKVAGALKSQVIGQFLSESILISLLSFFLAILLVELSLPGFNALADKELALDWTSHAGLTLAFVALVILVGVGSGSYPALYLSRLSPLAVFKGESQAGSGSSLVRKSLVVVQFSLSIIMMIATVVAFNQLEYIRGKDLGFNQSGLVVIDINSGGARANFVSIKNEMANVSSVRSVSVSSRVPGEWKNITQIQAVPADGPERNTQAFSFMAIDEQFLKTFEIGLAQGRNLSSEMGTDTTAIIINEAAARALGWDQAVEKELLVPVRNFRARVVGVVKDFHFQSLHETIGPLVLGHWSNPFVLIDYFTCRINTANISQTLSDLQRVHEQFDTVTPFEFNFLDERLEDFYQQDRRSGKIFSIAAGLTIIIACLGLLGLAAFAAEVRTKEIGVRKVLGASVSGIVRLLSLDFIKLVLVANVIAWPVAYYAMNRWLQDFSYRVEIGWGVFALVGGAALLIALLTVSFQAIKAALANPVEALRYE